MRCWRCGMRVGLNVSLSRLKGGATVEACSRCLIAWHEYVIETEEYFDLMEAERRHDLLNCGLMGESHYYSQITDAEFCNSHIVEASAALYRLSVEFFKPNEEARKNNLEVEAALRKLERDRPELG